MGAHASLPVAEVLYNCCFTKGACTMHTESEVTHCILPIPHMLTHLGVFHNDDAANWARRLIA